VTGASGGHIDEPVREDGSMGSSLRRRRVVALMAAAGLAGSGVAACGAATQRVLRPGPVRRDLTRPGALEPYARVVAAMKALPETDPRSWSRQAQIHQSYGRHASWLFLPWHRAYLSFFEQIGRELSGEETFAVPYWDWTAQPTVPAAFLDPASPLFAPGRAVAPGSAAAPEFVGPDRVAALLAERNFLVFGGQATARDDPRPDGPGYGLLEQGPHNYVHGFVGGSMSGFGSPLDPIFWAHHSFLDRLWQRWRGALPDAANWSQTRFTEFVDGRGRPVSVTVGELVAGSAYG
jgi:tyrosinase